MPTEINSKQNWKQNLNKIKREASKRKIKNCVCNFPVFTTKEHEFKEQFIYFYVIKRYDI